MAHEGQCPHCAAATSAATAGMPQMLAVPQEVRHMLASSLSPANVEGFRRAFAPQASQVALHTDFTGQPAPVPIPEGIPFTRPSPSRAVSSPERSRVSQLDDITFVKPLDRATPILAFTLADARLDLSRVHFVSPGLHEMGARTLAEMAIVQPEVTFAAVEPQQEGPRTGKWIDMTSERGKKLQAALDQADKMMDQAIKDLDKMIDEPGKHPNAEDRFKKYFGSKNVDDMKKVRDRFKETIKTKHMGGNRYSQDGEGHNRADTSGDPVSKVGDKSDWQVVFHPAFWETPAECSDSQPSVVLHELTHAAFDSGDAKPYSEGGGLSSDEKKKQLGKWAEENRAFKSPIKPQNKEQEEIKANEEKKERERPLLEADCYKFFAEDAYYAENPKPAKK